MDKKKLFWAIASVVIAVLTVWAILAQSKHASPAVLWQYLQNANKLWLIGSLVSMFGFIWFESFAIYRLASVLGYKKSVGTCTFYGAADVYFSAITPSATGGQPASAYFMLKDGISGPVVTVVLLVNLIMYTLALLSLGIVSILTHFDILLEFSIISKVLILIGAVVLLGLGITFFLMFVRPELLQKICDFFMRIMNKLKIVKYTNKRRAKLDKTMEDFTVCTQVLVGRRRLIVEVFFWNIMQRISQFGVSFFVFMSMGYGLKQSVDIMFIQCFVSMGSNSVPIPGSMGVADLIMLDGFKLAVGKGACVTMELLCRGISFYGCVLTGLTIVAFGYISRRLRKEL